MNATRTSNSEADTVLIGREVGEGLRPGDVVLLEGPLGAGKTAFVRGLADGLGCGAAVVSSPTFTIIQEYTGGTVLQHVDLYRLSPIEADDLGLDDLMEGNVLAVEWPDRWRGAPAAATRVVLEPLGGDRRRITIRSGEPRGSVEGYSTR